MSIIDSFMRRLETEREYLDSQGALEGYLLTFDFRKQKNECAEWINYKGKRGSHIKFTKFDCKTAGKIVKYE